MIKLMAFFPNSIRVLRFDDELPSRSDLWKGCSSHPTQFSRVLELRELEQRPRRVREGTSQRRSTGTS